MNTIERQTALIDKLYQLMHVSAEQGYEEMQCWFEYLKSEHYDGTSIGSRFSYVMSGDTISAALAYPGIQILNSVIPELHKIMKTHTGGEWTEFTLTLGKDGKAKIKFKYPDQDAAS